MNIRSFRMESIRSNKHEWNCVFVCVDEGRHPCGTSTNLWKISIKFVHLIPTISNGNVEQFIIYWHNVPLTFISVDMVFFMLFKRLIINMDSSETQIYTNIYIPFRKWLKFNQKMNTFNRSLRSPCPNILIYIVVIQSQTGQNIEYCLETLEMSHFLKPNWKIVKQITLYKLYWIEVVLVQVNVNNHKPS